MLFLSRKLGSIVMIGNETTTLQLKRIEREEDSPKKAMFVFEHNGNSTWMWVREGEICYLNEKRDTYFLIRKINTPKRLEMGIAAPYTTQIVRQEAKTQRPLVGPLVDYLTHPVLEKVL